MKRFLVLGFSALGLMAASTAAFSDGHLKHEKPIKARIAVMQLYSFNLGSIGAMVKGEVEYDAKSAQGHADNLAALSKLHLGGLWPPGSDAESNPGKTRALKLIWDTFPAIGEKQEALIKATTAMAATAGNGADALKASIGDVGAACKGCHEKYRQAKN